MMMTVGAGTAAGKTDENELSRAALKDTPRNNGFTLLELAIAMAGLALFTTAAIPLFIRQAENVAAKNVAKEISIIQEAAKWYYLQHLSWPNSIQALQAAGSLDPRWTGKNAWGAAYSLSSNTRTLTVSSIVPRQVAGLLVLSLPGAAQSGHGTLRTLTSAITAPGYEPDLADVTNTANAALTMARDSALPPHGVMSGFSGQAGRTPPCPSGQIMVGISAGGGDNVVGFHCQRVTRTGSLPGEHLSAIEVQIAELKSRYAQLLVRNQGLRIQHDRVKPEYDAFREWLEEKLDD